MTIDKNDVFIVLKLKYCYIVGGLTFGGGTKIW